MAIVNNWAFGKINRITYYPNLDLIRIAFAQMPKDAQWNRFDLDCDDKSDRHVILQMLLMAYENNKNVAVSISEEVANEEKYLFQRVSISE